MVPCNESPDSLHAVVYMASEYDLALIRPLAELVLRRQRHLRPCCLGNLGQAVGSLEEGGSRSSNAGWRPRQGVVAIEAVSVDATAAYESIVPGDFVVLNAHSYADLFACGHVLVPHALRGFSGRRPSAQCPADL